MRLRKAFDYLSTGNLAIVAITRQCNCRCAFCSLWKEKRDIDSKQFINSLDRLKDAGFRLIEFTGGEPTMLKELPEMISQTTSRDIFVQVMTNGTLLNEDICSQLAEAGTNLVNISVDHYKDEIASNYRKYPKINEKIKEGVKNIKKENLLACSTTLLTKDNCSDIKKIIDFVNNDLGIFFSFCPPEVALHYPLATDKNANTIMPTKEELIKAMQDILEMKKQGYRIINTKAYINDSIRWFQGKKVRYLCKGGRNIVYIDWNNDVYPCFRKPKICSIEELTREKMKDLKCNKCSFQCFREPSVFYTKKGKIEFIRDLRTLWPFLKSTGAISKKTVIKNK